MKKNQKNTPPPAKKKPGRETPKGPSFTWHYIIAFVAAFVLYGNTFQHEFTLDDDLYFVKHATVQKGTKGIPQIFSEGSMKGFEGNTTEPTYRPVTLTTFALEKQVSGNNSHSAHAINVIIYALVGLVLVYWLRQVFPDVHPWIHLIILLLFLSHPVHTEVVASVKSRDELLAGLFGFLAMAMGMKLDPGSWINRRSVAVFFIFLAALMSKESAITLTLMFPLTLFILRKESIRDIFMKSIPFGAGALAFLLIRQAVVPVAVGESKMLIINNVLYGINDFWTATATKLEILLVYLRLLVFPHPLSWDYSFNQVPIVNFGNGVVWFSLVIHLALIVLAILTLRRKPVISFTIVFYFITFALTNNIFYSVRATVGERFLLIPSMGFILLLVFGACHFLKINTTTFSGSKEKFIKYGSYVLIAVYTILTIQRNPDWKDNFTLFMSGLKSAPNSARVLGGIGFEYMHKAEQTTIPAEKAEYFANSLKYYKQSLDILPSYNYSSYNMGVACYEMGDTTSSIDAFRKTLVYSPDYHNAILNLGLLYLLRQNLDSGIYFLNVLKQKYPDDKDAPANLAVGYLHKKDYESALKNADDAIRTDPDNGNNYRTKAAILHEMGREEEAQKFIRLASSPFPSKGL